MLELLAGKLGRCKRPTIEIVEACSEASQPCFRVNCDFDLEVFFGVEGSGLVTVLGVCIFKHAMTSHA